MLKKVITMFLAVMIFTVASNASVFAKSGGSGNENQKAAKQENKTEKGDLKSLIKEQEKTGGLNISNKSTLAEYERQKRQSKGMSTTTKVLIGVGIAVAVVAIVAVAASRDKIRTF
jgi:CHASE3 domain sensor protein